MHSRTSFSLQEESFLKAFAQTRAFLLGRPVRPVVSPNGEEILFLRSAARSSRHDLFALSLADGQTHRLCTAGDLRAAPEQTTPEEKARLERQRITDTGLTSFELSASGQWVLVPLGGALYLFERSSGKSRTLLPQTHPPVMDARFTPDGRGIAFVCQHDLWILDMPQALSDAPAPPRPLTTGGTAERFFGLPEFVAQEEMGRFEGFWFAPDGQHALVAVVDESQVELFSIVDPGHPERPAATFRYPRAGKANADVGLIIVSRTHNGKPVPVLWDHAAYPYLARVLWQSASAAPAIWVQSRDQRSAALLSVNVATGDTTFLFDEHDHAWINLDPQLPRFVPDGSALLHVSESSGDRELQLRSVDGKPLAVLVPANAGFLQLVSIDSPCNRVLVLLGDALSSRLAWVPLRPEENFAPAWFIDDLEGDASDRHDIVVGGPSGAPLVVETRVSAHTMPTLRVLDSAGNLRCELADLAEEPPFPVNAQFFTVTPRALNAAVLRPTDFDEARKYPVIVHVYGGPHALLVKTDQRQFIFDQWLADRGAIVVAIDNRGTPRRGASWERAIKNAFGSDPLDDQIEGITALEQLIPQMDLSRVGIYGWSFGGFMAALAALRRPDVFKVAVAGAPVVDWLDYDTHYTERYLGLPQESADAYIDSNLLNHAGKLDVPLLLIHGTADDNVYFFHSLRLADALLRNGQDFDFLPLPQTTHQIGDPQVRERVWGRIAAYLFDHL